VSKETSRILWAAIFIVLFLIALPLDIPLSTFAHDSGIASWLKAHHAVALAIRFPGRFYFTLVVCAYLLADSWRKGIRVKSALYLKPSIVFLAGVLSGLNAPLKMLVGRIRPYHGIPPFELHPFKYGIMNTEASFSFPSGDASLAFAMAMSLSFTIPKLRPLWWTLAVIVAFERIAENAHYPSDVVAGAALGVGVAFLARGAVRVFMRKRMQIPAK
jgi:membrane-associated phospholipid phosphatase